MSWVKDAVCVGMVELFFGKPNEQPYHQTQRYAVARALCASCPVLAECQAAADIEEADTVGIFGFRAGETPNERISRRTGTVRGPRRRKPCGTPTAYQRGCRCSMCCNAEALRWKVRQVGGLPAHINHGKAS